MAKAVRGNKMIDQISLEDYKGEYIVFFFYPLDFTFVCPTELHAFENKREEFEKRGAQLIACSVDSPFSHFAWLNTSKSKGGIEGVNYPIVSDIHKTIARDYGVLKEEDGISYRGLFLIDKKGIVRHLTINDLPLGRSVDEAIRMLDSLIFHEENGEVCPANWKEGEKSLKPTQEGLVEFFT